MSQPHPANCASLVIGNVLHMASAQRRAASIFWHEKERCAEIALVPPYEPTLLCLIIHSVVAFLGDLENEAAPLSRYRLLLICCRTNHLAFDTETISVIGVYDHLAPRAARPPAICEPTRRWKPVLKLT